MQDQEQNSTSPSFQSVVLASTLTVASGSILYSYLRSKKFYSKLRDYSFPSKDIQPEIYYSGTSFYAKIPTNSIRRTLFEYGPKTQVSEIEIQLVNRGNGEGDRDDRRSFTLTREYPFYQLLITPEKPYAYQYRTREDGLSWSKWSEFIPFVSEPVPFRILPGIPSRERCTRMIGIMSQEARRCNILFLGKPGAGKSSLKNRLATAIRNSWTFAANTAPVGLTNTQYLTEHGLISEKIFLYDLPGWEENYHLNRLPPILEGQVDIDEVTVSWLKGDTPGPNDARTAQQRNGGRLPKIDVVFLVMSAPHLERSLECHQRLLQVLRNLSIPVIGIVTKVDKIASRDDQPVSLEKFWDDPRVIARCEQVPLDVKFPIANPPTSWNQKVGVDELMLQIVRTAQEMSQADA